MPRQRDADRRDFLYRHTNGTLQRKLHYVVMAGGGPAEYFNSPFVQHWWRHGDAEPGTTAFDIRAIRRLIYDTLVKRDLERRQQKQMELGV